MVGAAPKKFVLVKSPLRLVCFFCNFINSSLVLAKHVAGSIIIQNEAKLDKGI